MALKKTATFGILLFAGRNGQHMIVVVDVKFGDGTGGNGQYPFSLHRKQKVAQSSLNWASPADRSGVHCSPCDGPTGARVHGALKHVIMILRPQFFFCV